MKIDDNPFERWDLDPGADEQTLTRKLRQKSRLVGPDEREQLQDDWRKLTSDPVARARWAALTPPPVADGDDLWKMARDAVSSPTSPELPPLRASLEDALVLPRLDDEQLYARPPFLPEVMRPDSPEER